MPAPAALDLPLAVCVVVSHAGRYLLVRRAAGRPAPGYWTPVTGKLEAGETLPEAARREVAEETGLEVVIGPELHRSPTSNGEFQLVWFRATPTEPSAALKLAEDEVAEARWLTPTEVLALDPLFPATRAYFESEAGGRGGRMTRDVDRTQ